jgi:hypothetical protein
MVVSGYGQETWERVKEKAGFEDEVFVSTEAYPDELTYALVGAASSILKTPPADVLEAFGVYWVVKTAQEGYGDMMAAGGKTLGEFLENLPNFHSRVSMIFPHLSPPRFYCSDIKPNSIHMHYQSHRDGLAPFVVGLFKGLGQMFSTPMTVEQMASKSAGADHDEFIVRW